MSLDKSTVLRAFNKCFLEFLDDIITIFPEKKELLDAKTSFETLKRANPSIVVKSWYNYVYLPYIDVIEKDDISFFFDKDYSSDVSHLPNSQKIMSVIDMFREPVREMGENNKIISMKYLKNLCKLSYLYMQ